MSSFTDLLMTTAVILLTFGGVFAAFLFSGFWAFVVYWAVKRNDRKRQNDRFRAHKRQIESLRHKDLQA